jgi:DNA uptake protein ComE-like DNA-binding protein
MGEALVSVDKEAEVSSSSGYYAVPEVVPESFTFDPNEADSTQLLRLGLAPFQVRSIYRYRAKGGRFSTKDDFRRVYRLTNEQWERLSPLISIAPKYRLVTIVPHSDVRNTSSRPASYATDTIIRDSVPCSYATSRSKPAYVQKLSGDETIDINLADSALLCRVPGIGPYFARRIIQYRRRLGGYTSAAQLLQIEGFPADAIAWIQVPDTCQVQKLQINSLSTRRLMKHPYMGYYRASEIADYRRMHGPIRSIEVLKSLPHFTEEDILRLAPYLSFE